MPRRPPCDSRQENDVRFVESEPRSNLSGSRTRLWILTCGFMPVGAGNAAHVTRPADTRGAVDRVGRAVGRCSDRSSLAGGVVVAERRGRAGGVAGGCCSGPGTAGYPSLAKQQVRRREPSFGHLQGVQPAAQMGGRPAGVVRHLVAMNAEEARSVLARVDQESAVCGPNSAATSTTTSAGKPPRRACSRTVSASSVSCTQ
jgi:hypothetical protein